MTMREYAARYEYDYDDEQSDFEQAQIILSAENNILADIATDRAALSLSRSLLMNSADRERTGNNNGSCGGSGSEPSSAGLTAEFEFDTKPEETRADSSDLKLFCVWPLFDDRL